MSVSHRYKNFGKNLKTSSEESEELTSDQIEDEKLKAFEAGYRAGWDDSSKAVAESNEKIGIEFAKNLQDISFTYHEALAKLTSEFEPVMKGILNKLLPQIVSDAVATHVLDQVTSLIRDNTGQDIEIVVSPQNVETVQRLAGEALTDPFRIVSESTLGEGQAFVRIGSEERQVDIDGVVEGVSEAMAAFFHESRNEVSK